MLFRSCCLVELEEPPAIWRAVRVEGQDCQEVLVGLLRVAKALLADLPVQQSESCLA